MDGAAERALSRLCDKRLLGRAKCRGVGKNLFYKMRISGALQNKPTADKINRERIMGADIIPSAQAADSIS